MERRERGLRCAVMWPASENLDVGLEPRVTRVSECSLEGWGDPALLLLLGLLWPASNIQGSDNSQGKKLPRP